jgi:hypothetical protein
MGVGQASLRGLLDEAEDINDISKHERVAAREGVALEPAEGETFTPEQEQAAELAEDKAYREDVIKRGDKPADVDAEQAEAESKIGETSKPPVEPGTIGPGEPPPGTDEDETGREQADGSEDPEAGDPEFSPDATKSELEAAGANEQDIEDAPEKPPVEGDGLGDGEADDEDEPEGVAEDSPEANGDTSDVDVDAPTESEVIAELDNEKPGTEAEPEGFQVDAVEVNETPAVGELTRGQKAAQTRAANKAKADVEAGGKVI